MADGGGAAEAAPPVSGLGNFKGVMLCNRPSDSANKPAASGADGTMPFKTTCSHTEREQLGLAPCRNFEPAVKKRGPSAALRRHVEWLKELQSEMREEREQFEIEDKDKEVRKQKMKAGIEKHRSAVKEMLAARSKLMDEEQRAVDKLKREQRESTKKPAVKPLWAMTETEKDEFEEEAADDLINFAEGLDFEKFVGDLEFRQGLEALKDRTGKLKKEQEAFKESLVRDFNVAHEEEQSTEPGSPRNLEDGIDGSSIAGSDAVSATSSRRRARAAARANLDGKAEWDNSTNAGDGPVVDERVRDEATMVLESNSQMRAVHSQASVQKMIQKVRAQQPLSLREQMEQDDGQVAAPMVVASEDTLARQQKQVNPSQLPYLYRSPAV
ncbi:unnamed protein product [Prorocentrum cordatum]|uniref:Uncharacterized protein n=1 Tax=Prorocentrum cordatum TaxID=2364126 RepID=A0ABN9UBD0_9DINO|nr:unnamed protein product [Polarella glacialis]